MIFKPNERINNQYLVQKQFAGGMGVVYIAIDEVTKRRLAIKTLSDDLLNNRVAVERFEREARCWINLGRHCNIVHAISFHRGEMPLLFLEFIEGPTLSYLIKSEPAGMDFFEMVNMASQLCDGLCFAHSCPMPNGSLGVIHRDIKPANILLSRMGVPKLTDFGLVKTQNDACQTTGILGTFLYMSPEQCVNSHQVTTKADVYSLGVVLYEMLTGNRPQRKHSIAMSRPDADPDLVQLVEGCLEHAAENRPTSKELLRELQAMQKRFVSPADPCPVCSYRGRKESLYCPVCGTDRASIMNGQWRCGCGKPNRLTFAFCLDCGSRRADTARCSVCDNANPTTYRFCVSCGSRISSSES